MSTREIEILVGVVTALFGIGCVGYLIPNYIQAGYGSGISPRTFPYICAWAITGLSACLVFSRLRAMASSRPDKATPIDRRALLRVGAGIAAMVLSLALIEYVGYVVGGAVMVALFMALMGERRLLPVICTSLAWSGFLWVLFEKILETPLS